MAIFRLDLPTITVLNMAATKRPQSRIKKLVKTPTLRKNRIGVIKHGTSKTLRIELADNQFVTMPIEHSAIIETQYASEIHHSDNVYKFACQDNMVLITFLWERKRSIYNLNEWRKCIKRLEGEELQLFYDIGSTVPKLDAFNHVNENAQTVFDRAYIYGRMPLLNAIALAQRYCHIDGFITRWKVTGIALTANPSHHVHCTPFAYLRDVTQREAISGLIAF